MIGFKLLFACKNSEIIRYFQELLGKYEDKGRIRWGDSIVLLRQSGGIGLEVCRKYVSLAEELGGFMRNKKAGQLVTSYR